VRFAEVFGPALVVALRQHGAEAPLITSVVLEAPPPRAWIGFSNTDRVCVSLRPGDLPALCQHYEASDRRILFSRLLVDAQLTYERIRSPSFRWNLQSYFRRPRPVRFVRGENRSPEVAADTIVHERAMALLKQSLSTAQLEQYEKCSYFDVKGSHSGKRYRIHHGRSMNVDQLDKIGRRMRGLCFYPRGDLAAGDVMLAQKLALELFEAETLKIANRIW
jgi:hypothetical protein